MAVVSLSRSKLPTDTQAAMLVFLLTLDRLRQLLSEGAATSMVLLSLGLGAGAVVYMATRPHPSDTRQDIYRPSSTLPVLDNTLDTLKHNEDVYDWLLEHCEKAGGRTWRLKFAGRPTMYVVYTPETNEDVEKTHFANFVKGERLWFVLADMLGSGIFMVDGEAWAAQRKAASLLTAHFASP